MLIGNGQDYPGPVSGGAFDFKAPSALYLQTLPHILQPYMNPILLIQFVHIKAGAIIRNRYFYIFPGILCGNYDGVPPPSFLLMP